MSSSGVEELEFIDTLVTKEDCLNNLKGKLPATVRKLIMDQRYKLQHDGNPKYTLKQLSQGFTEHSETACKISRYKLNRISVVYF